MPERLSRAVYDMRLAMDADRWTHAAGWGFGAAGQSEVAMSMHAARQLGHWPPRDTEHQQSRRIITDNSQESPNGTPASRSLW